MNPNMRRTIARRQAALDRQHRTEYVPLWLAALELVDVDPAEADRGSPAWCPWCSAWQDRQAGARPVTEPRHQHGCPWEALQAIVDDTRTSQYSGLDTAGSGASATARG